MAWTTAQQKVIDTRNKNILVSAAAGSGKTAVLVERIISMITDGEHPLDIDHLLVVTFTNAAAAEMRERIGKAIDAKLRLEPDNRHLQKQMSLLQSAQITTIHSFCLNVIRNYFHRIDLDPSFKIAEESEITLMKSDVISDILERWYEEGNEEFHAFVESYSYSKSDLPIEELVIQLYNFSMSDPWPKSWLQRKRGMFELDTLMELKQTSWMQELLEYVKTVLNDLLIKNAEALSVCSEVGGPMAYEAALLSDQRLLRALLQEGDYEAYASIFSGISYDRLSNKREEGVEQWKKDRVKELREEVKKGIKELSNQYFFQPPEEMLKDMQAVGKLMQVLFELTLEFMDEFAKKKEEKNLVDFNDLEHFALKILVKEQEGELNYCPTDAAIELSEQFDEILIDEYQDSNMVQETILKSISREELGNPNRFMVGDVKQSIYKFRLAMPEIFLQKYNTYSCGDKTEEGSVNLYQRIDLDKNFRSRQTVLSYVNKIFEQIMQKSVGGIIYDEAAALKYGELYEETLPVKEIRNISEEAEVFDEAEFSTADTTDGRVLSEQILSRIATEVELSLVTEEAADTKEQNEIGAVKEKRQENETSQEGISIEGAASDAENDEEAAYTKKEMEARLIARRIRELTDPDTGMLVFDQKAKQHRPASYRDIVILLRSMTGWSEVFVNALMQEGIPAYADTGTGYFQTLEIRTILNLLRIIDNPIQDIPLVGVLYSPIVGLTSTELAIIRAGNRKVSMYSALLSFLGMDKEDCFSGKNGDNNRREADREGDREKAEQEEIDREKTDREIRDTKDIDRVKTGKSDMVSEYNMNEATVNAVEYSEGINSDQKLEYELHMKLTNFMTLLSSFRSMVNYKPIHEILQLALEQTGYYYYVCAMPGGEQRRANIDMLVAQAVRFEKGSYSGLFHFIRYMEKLHKYEVDFGEAATAGEQDNTVRIMSIHKSKGLEFPIVIVGGMSKQFNTQDLRSSVVLHSELGVGPEYIDSQLRTKVPTLLKKVIQKKLQVENLGEELRVLYVAMTRAREKLIMTGYLKSMDEIKQKRFSSFELLSAKSYLDWVLPAMMNHMGTQPQLGQSSLEIVNQDMRISVMVKEQLLQEEMKKQLFRTIDEQELNSIRVEDSCEPGLREEIRTIFNYHYPYAKEAGLKVKMTVSELKKLGQFQDEELSVNLHQNQVNPTTSEDQSINITVPAFIQKTEKVTSGTDRGTLYHKVLELIDLTSIHSKEDLAREFKRLTDQGMLIQEDIDKLKIDSIYAFTTSQVADRMRNAKALGKLYQEQQFVIGIPAKEVMKNTDSEELILVQGIIDVFFEEEGELVLLDYKSDLVTNNKQLIDRYQVQLQYYKRALEQMRNQRVKDMILYSLPLAKEIRIEE